MYIHIYYIFTIVYTSYYKTNEFSFSFDDIMYLRNVKCSMCKDTIRNYMSIDLLREESEDSSSTLREKGKARFLSPLGCLCNNLSPICPTYLPPQTVLGLCKTYIDHGWA